MPARGYGHTGCSHVAEQSTRTQREQRTQRRRGAEAQRRRAQRSRVVTIDELSFQIIGAAMEVHTDVGPGLNEKTYDACFGDQLTTLGLQFEHQVQVPVDTQRQSASSPRFGSTTSCGIAVIVETQSRSNIHPVHVAQMRSYLKMTGLTLGLSSTSTSSHLRDGIKRVVNGYVPAQRSSSLCASASSAPLRPLPPLRPRGSSLPLGELNTHPSHPPELLVPQRETRLAVQGGDFAQRA